MASICSARLAALPGGMWVSASFLRKASTSSRCVIKMLVGAGAPVSVTCFFFMAGCPGLCSTLNESVEMPATSSRNGSANNSQAFAYFGWLTLLVYLANPLGTLVDIQTSYMLKNHLHATATIPGLGRNGGKIDRQAARR